MSLDNGVYIIKLKANEGCNKNAYYVNLTHAIGNIYKDLNALVGMVEQSQSFPDYDEARKAAIILDDEHETEHGVYLIEKFAKDSLNELVQRKNGVKENGIQDLF
jgi:hypothetical protein